MKEEFFSSLGRSGTPSTRNAIGRSGRVLHFDSSYRAITPGWSAIRKLSRNGVPGSENN